MPEMQAGESILQRRHSAHPCTSEQFSAANLFYFLRLVVLARVVLRVTRAAGRFDAALLATLRATFFLGAVFTVFLRAGFAAGFSSTATSLEVSSASACD